MQITVTATPEMVDTKFNGVEVPLRIWRGKTQGGVPVEALILMVLPEDKQDLKRFKKELAPFQVPGRILMRIGSFPKAEK